MPHAHIAAYTQGDGKAVLQVLAGLPDSALAMACTKFLPMRSSNICNRAQDVRTCPRKPRADLELQAHAMDNQVFPIKGANWYKNLPRNDGICAAQVVACHRAIYYCENAAVEGPHLAMCKLFSCSRTMLSSSVSTSNRLFNTVMRCSSSRYSVTLLYSAW